ncbi:MULTISPECIES: hypothetical protein [Shinella]|jgi:hypothetical protein|uniref:Uncharacterized protein n=1 Tax=Shinella granuli TaxID=323621 RepID=A0A4R2CRC0_SHIGR|nr:MULTISPECIES: hypothetical protein [Shinella]TCN43526.1 hypothetical protein EV665_110124 [Shinella granuli]
MKKLVINVVSDDAIEIMVPKKSKDRLRCSVVCLCCERADQPMDDDGCGICDACLGVPVRATDDLDGLEIATPSPHLSLTARNR